MTTWEYATVPLIVHATKQILDQWGEDGWELVQVLPGPGQNGDQSDVGSFPRAAPCADHPVPDRAALLLSFGLVVYALAVVSDIRRERPGVAVDWVSEPGFAPLVALCPDVRRVVPTLTGDRPPAPDIEAISLLIENGTLESSCGIEVK